MNIKEILVAIREACIILVFVLLLAMPKWVNNRLENAGFKSLDLGFAEWEARIEESKREVEDVKQYTEETQEQLAQVSEKLEQLTLSPNFSNSAVLKRQVNALRVEVDQSNQKLMRSNLELERSIDNHRFLLNEVSRKNN